MCPSQASYMYLPPSIPLSSRNLPPAAGKLQEGREMEGQFVRSLVLSPNRGRLGRTPHRKKTLFGGCSLQEATAQENLLPNTTLDSCLLAEPGNRVLPSAPFSEEPESKSESARSSLVIFISKMCMHHINKSMNLSIY